MRPAGVSPVETNRHKAMSSFLARATIRVLRVPERLSAVRTRYHCASALASWNRRKRQSQLDHATTHPGVAGFGQTLLAPLGPALVRCAGETRVARDGAPVAHAAGQYLVHEHIGRLDADPNNPGQQQHHRIGALCGSMVDPRRTPCSSSRIWSARKRRRAMSRRNSARVFGGRAGNRGRFPGNQAVLAACWMRSGNGGMVMASGTCRRSPR